MLYRVYFEPSEFTYTIACEDNLEIDQFVNHGSRISKEPLQAHDLQHDLRVIMNDQVSCPPNVVDFIEPELTSGHSEEVFLTYQNYATLELSSHNQDILTISPQLHINGTSVLLNACLLSMRCRAFKAKRVLLHGSGIETHGKGMVLLGDTRAGKSTFTVMASLKASNLHADDQILVEIDDVTSQPVAYPAKKKFTLRKDIAENHSEFSIDEMKKISTPDGIKYVIDEESGIVKTTTKMPVDYLFFCDGLSNTSATVVNKLNKAEYYSRLLENFYPLFGEHFKVFQRENKHILELASTLHKQCFGYSISIGTDILKSPEQAIKNIMHQLE